MYRAIDRNVYGVSFWAGNSQVIRDVRSTRFAVAPFQLAPCRQACVVGTVGHRIASELRVHPSAASPLDLAGQDLFGSVAGDAPVVDRPKLRHLGA